ncbi:MAG: phosphomannomutase [Planctomycetota bacterium]|jgi:phosphomannomutase
MIQKIKFGTDGWRAIIAKDYTVENVARVAYATAQWIKESGNNSMVLGYDCRFGGTLFSEVVINVMCSEGIKVYYDKAFVTTPMISLAALELKTFAGIIITASHNPPTYNGYKLKSHFGGPSIEADIQKVEDMIPDTFEIPSVDFADMEAKGLLEYINLEDMYFAKVEAAFDLDIIRNSNFNLAYDAMYGSGQNIFKRIMPKAKHLHCEHRPGFDGQAPEPIDKNLQELSHFLRANDDYHLGLANDGDADRIGLYSSKGKFIDAHHIILILIHILHKYQGMSGKVVVAFSASPKIKKMCKAYGLEIAVTKIGFKNIAPYMISEDVLVGGEESGGIAVKGHIPERDGIWDGLVIMEHLAKHNTTIEALIEEVYEVVGAFSYNRNDLHITNELKASIIANCKAGNYTSFGSYNVEEVETIDGFKFHLGNERVVMIRPSGTEPVLRVYGEAESMEEVNKMLEVVKSVIL